MNWLPREIYRCEAKHNLIEIRFFGSGCGCAPCGAPAANRIFEVVGRSNCCVLAAVLMGLISY